MSLLSLVISLSYSLVIYLANVVCCCLCYTNCCRRRLLSFSHLFISLHLSPNNSSTEGDAFGFDMKIQMVKSEKEYVGCKMIATKTKEEIFSFQFDDGVEIDENDLNDIRADCLQLIGIICEDGKMCATSNGLSTCGASYPCPCCLWHLRDQSLPSWMEDYGTSCASEEEIDKDNDNGDDNDDSITYTYFEKRMGKYNKETCFKNFDINRGGDNGPIPTEQKKQAYSVVTKPLLNIDDDLLWVQPVDPLHLLQGNMTHLTSECSTQLESCIGDDDEDFTSKIQDVQEHIDSMESIAKEDEDYL